MFAPESAPSPALSPPIPASATVEISMPGTVLKTAPLCDGPMVACTWLAWDGVPRYGDGNVWTPLKAFRRIQDHLLDYLAEIHSVLHSQPTIPDTWHGRKVTLDSDWARFTELDLGEASSRFRRYAKLYRVTIEALSTEQLDCRREDAWIIRQICHHVANVTYYARQMGDLSPPTCRLSIWAIVVAQCSVLRLLLTARVRRASTRSDHPRDRIDLRMINAAMTEVEHDAFLE